MKAIFKAILIFIWALSPLILNAEGNVKPSRVPPYVWIHQYQQQPEYQYTQASQDVGLSAWDIFANWLNSLIDSFFEKPTVSKFVSFLPYVCIVIIFVGLAWYFNKFGGGALFERGPRTLITKGVLSDDINSIDFEKLIYEAEQNNNLRWALRWQYLKYLKYLDDQGWIIWQAHKTNTDYYREIEDVNQRDKYRRVARYYEDTWYGDWELQRAEYNNIVEFIKTPTHSLAA